MTTGISSLVANLVSDHPSPERRVRIGDLNHWVICGWLAVCQECAPRTSFSQGWTRSWSPLARQSLSLPFPDIITSACQILSLVLLLGPVNYPYDTMRARLVGVSTHHPLITPEATMLRPPSLHELVICTVNIVAHTFVYTRNHILSMLTRVRILPPLLARCTPMEYCGQPTDVLHAVKDCKAWRAY